MSARGEQRRVVGFVCEGSTDVVVLRALVESVIGPIEPRPLQPQTDELDRTMPGAPAGWSEVRAWCERVASYDDYFSPDIGEPLDLLVIAIDLDIAIRAGVQKAPANLKGYDAKALCDVVKSWLPAPVHERVVIAIPVMSVEAWILAALFPRFGKPELELHPADVLVRRKKIGLAANRPWKRVNEYRPFAQRVASRRDRVGAACEEARRFIRKLERSRPD